MLSRAVSATFFCVEKRLLPIATNIVFLNSHQYSTDDARQSFNRRYVLLNEDPRYNRIRSQSFEPIPVSKSSPKEGLFAMSTLEFQERPGQLFGGVPYTKLPIATVRARWNNTIITVHTGDKVYAQLSCRSVGFHNAKKKTELAGEMVGLAAAERSLNKGCHKHIRVVVHGIGIGRRSSMRGLVRGGMEIVSITDRTPVTNESLPQRPRKIRRI